MSNLRDHEWVMINEVLLKLYTISDAKALKKEFLLLIRSLIPYAMASFATIDITTRKMDMAKSVFVDIVENDLNRYNEEFGDEDYMFNAFGYMKSVSYKDTSVLDESARRRTKFYQEFLLPLNTPFAGGLILVSDQNLLGVVTLFRSKGYGDLTGRDLFILDQFKDHLTNILLSLEQPKNNQIDCWEKRKSIMQKYFLSSREMEIAELIYKGISNAEIAAELLISNSTVKKHVYNVFKKLDVNSRPQMISKMNRT